MTRFSRFQGTLAASLLGSFTTSLALGLPLSPPVLAQVSHSQIRAANLARMEAEITDCP